MPHHLAVYLGTRFMFGANTPSDAPDSTTSAICYGIRIAHDDSVGDTFKAVPESTIGGRPKQRKVDFLPLLGSSGAPHVDSMACYALLQHAQKANSCTVDAKNQTVIVLPRSYRVSGDKLVSLKYVTEDLFGVVHDLEWVAQNTIPTLAATKPTIFFGFDHTYSESYDDEYKRKTRCVYSCSFIDTQGVISSAFNDIVETFDESQFDFADMASIVTQITTEKCNVVLFSGFALNDSFVTTVKNILAQVPNVQVHVLKLQNLWKLAATYAKSKKDDTLLN